MPKKYDVGYGKPPIKSQFKPGQSGNLRGRKKGVENLKTIFLQELAAPVIVSENGRRRRMSRQEVLVKGLIVDAVKGNHRARKLVFDTLAQLERSGISNAGTQQTVLGDEKIIARLRARLAGPTGNKE